MDYIALAFLGIMPALVIIGGLKDLTSMTIPNWISGLLILGFFPAAFIVGLPPTQVAINVGVAMGALVIGATMFALRWIGGGDAKLMAAACLWLGLGGAAPFVLTTAVVGGLLCLFLILMRQYAAPFILGGPGWVRTLMEPKGDIPYGVAIAVGALLTYPASGLVSLFVAG